MRKDAPREKCYDILHTLWLLLSLLLFIYATLMGIAYFTPMIGESYAYVRRNKQKTSPEK